MSKRKAEFFVMDIFVSIVKNEEYTKEIQNSTQLQYDCKTWDAVIRELEIIGEATKHLIALKIFTKDKRDIVDFRNILSHHYFGIDEEIVWDITRTKLPQLKNELIDIMDTFPNKKETVLSFMNDNDKIPFLYNALKNLL